MAKHWWVLAGGQTGTEDAGVLCPYLVLHHSRNSAFEKILHFHVPVCKFAKKLEVNAHFGWTKEYSRASIGACNGGAGSCICMGPQVCGSWGPFPMGTWQSYTSACCGCVPAPPVAPVAAAAPVAAPVAAAQWQHQWPLQLQQLPQLTASAQFTKDARIWSWQVHAAQLPMAPT